MDWFNYIGLMIVVAMLVPNVIYALKHKFPENNEIPRYMPIAENLGRYGAMAFMVFNIPYTWSSYFIDQTLLAYIIVNAALVVAYIALFFVFWNKKGIVKALLLSLLPSVIFIFSGIMVLSVPLMMFALIFAPTHIYISVRTI